MKNNAMKFFLVIVFIVSVFGCATTGKRLDNNKISEIKNGVTTEQEIRAMFGKPYSVTNNSENKKVLVYFYSKYEPSAASYIPIVNLFVGNTTIESNSLSITIDSDTGMVKDHSYTESESNIKTGVLER